MTVQQRIDALVEWGKTLTVDPAWIYLAAQKNPWFIAQSVEKALAGLIRYLDGETLLRFAKGYNLPEFLTQKPIGVVMAGNIPLAGAHDIICVLLAGHTLIAKLSSQDEILPKAVIAELLKIEPRFQVEFRERLTGCAAYIATGSDNTSRYFEYYFGKYPHIIRKNRTAVAILDGSETDDELRKLADDVFDYFGLGCRNVSKLFLPEGFEIQRLLEAFSVRANQCALHHKYANNYDYQKACLLLNKTPHFDNGGVILQPSSALFSPISVVYYEFWNDENQLKMILESHRDKIQCIVGKDGLPFGTAQNPSLFDFADGIDTMAFLTSL